MAPITQTDGTLIEPLGLPTLNSDEVDAIVAWLETLTDERVRIASAPSIIRNSSCPMATEATRTSLSQVHLASQRMRCWKFP